MPLDGSSRELDKTDLVLMRAISIINIQGWIQCRMRGPDGVCLAAAIDDAAAIEAKKYGVPSSMLYKLAEERILRNLNVSSLMVWNDNLNRNRRQVINAIISSMSGQPGYLSCRRLNKENEEPVLSLGVMMLLVFLLGLFVFTLAYEIGVW